MHGGKNDFVEVSFFYKFINLQINLLDYKFIRYKSENNFVWTIQNNCVGRCVELVVGMLKLFATCHQCLRIIHKIILVI